MTKQQVQLKAILFDYGGVLADEGFHNGLVALANEQGLDATAMLNEGKKAVYDSGFVLGQGSAADFWALMRTHAADIIRLCTPAMDDRRGTRVSCTRLCHRYLK